MILEGNVVCIFACNTHRDLRIRAESVPAEADDHQIHQLAVFTILPAF